MVKLGKNAKMNICTPAFIYFIMSMLSLLLVGLQNIGNQNT